MTLSSSLDYYSRLLDLFEKEIKVLPFEVLRDDFKSIVRSMCAEISAQLPVGLLEHRLVERIKIDTGSLTRAVEILESATMMAPRGALSRSPNIADEIQRLKGRLDDIAGSEGQLSRLEITLRLEWELSALFDDILASFAGNEPQLDELIALLKKKLDQLEEGSVMLLWAQLESQLKPRKEYRTASQATDLVDASFLELADANEARAKIALYLCRIKPQLTKVSALRTAAPSASLSLLGMARLLASKGPSLIEPVSEDEVFLLRNLSRLMIVWQGVLKEPAERLCDVLGVSPNGLIAKNGDERRFRQEMNQIGDEKRRAEVLMVLLRKIIGLTSLMSVKDHSLEITLHRYKLGLEIYAPENQKELKDRASREERLQRDVCRFLVERGIKAFGTGFGSAEVDLLLGSPDESFVVGTKVYRKSVTENAIQANVAQLFSYMMREVPNPRGILVIFNFTDTHILTPERWIKGRLWILPINVGPVLPGRLGRSLEIVMTEGSGMIDCVSTGPPPKKKPSPITRRKRRT